MSWAGSIGNECVRDPSDLVRGHFMRVCAKPISIAQDTCQYLETICNNHK